MREPRQFRVLVSSLRQEVLDAFAFVGPCSIAEAAVILGRKPTALYRHVRLLEHVGLLLRVGMSQQGAGRPTAIFDVPGRPIFIHQGALAGRAEKTIPRYVHAMLRSAGRGYDRALLARSSIRWGKNRNLWAARWKGWLNDRELRLVTAHLSQLIDLLHSQNTSDHSARRLHEITFVLAPTRPDRK